MVAARPDAAADPASYRLAQCPPVKLYVCWGTFSKTPRPGGHPCGNAYHALREAGHDPEVIKAYGLAALPELFNPEGGAA